MNHSKHLSPVADQLTASATTGSAKMGPANIHNVVGSVDRRQFLRYSSFLAASALLPGNAGALIETDWGQGKLTVLSDGQLVLPGSLVLPDTVDKAEVEAVLAQFDMNSDQLTPDCNVSVWQDGDKKVLFDVGAGSNFVPTTGKLLENMEAAGIDPLEITDVVFTHAHPDHLWGLLDDFDELICPDATYHMAAAEWNYWLADDTLSKTPEVRQAFVAGAQNRFPVIEERIKLFEPGSEIVGGIEAIDTSGHTPGHTSFALHAGSESLLILGDAITNVALSFLHPEWPSGSDQDPQKAIKTRLSLLDRLVHDKSRIVGFHMPHPGVGFVEEKDSAYRYVAE